LQQGIESSGIFYHWATSWAVQAHAGANLPADFERAFPLVSRLNSIGFLTQAAGHCNQNKDWRISTFKSERVKSGTYDLTSRKRAHY
jgi:hypothetical protein